MLRRVIASAILPFHPLKLLDRAGSPSPIVRPLKIRRRPSDDGSKPPTLTLRELRKEGRRMELVVREVVGDRDTGWVAPLRISATVVMATRVETW
eukprot:1321582-Amorphochlora_amoeboformis.AAC.4